MSGPRYQLLPAHYDGVTKPIVCQVSVEASPLVALTNWLNLVTGPGSNSIPPDPVEESVIVNPIKIALIRLMPALENIDRLRVIPSRKEHFLKLVASLGKGLHLNPSCRSTRVFQRCDEILVFIACNIKVLHGWLSDPNDKELFNAIGNCARQSLLNKISTGDIKDLLAGSSNPLSLSKRIKKFAESGITRHGLKTLHEEINDRQLAVLCIKDQFEVICKSYGDLFVLETNEHILKRFKEAVWKRLTLSEEDSFYVSMRFDPVKGQKNINKATEWIEGKLSELNDSGDKGKKKMLQRNIKKEVKGEVGKVPKSDEKEVPKSDEKEEIHEKDHVPPAEKEAPIPPTLADRFLSFLSEYGVGGNAPSYEGVISGIKSINLCTHIPFLFIQRYNGQLAIDIQDQYPSVHNELLQSLISCLVKNGFDKTVATEHAKLEIVGLPEPKSTQKFVAFVEDNEMIRPYKLHNGIWDNTTTETGRNMGLGYFNYMFDKFDVGKCWGQGENEWDETNMEVRNKGKEFIINKEAEQEATQELVVHNLLKLFQIIRSRYEGKTVKQVPAFFDSLQHDILTAPDPKGDRETWMRYSKLMRSPLALKAPVVRSGLIINFYQVLFLRLILEPLELATLLKKLGDNWRLGARKLDPFLQVYKYRNDISENFMYDKWEQNHWHVLKYSRHFIEHVLVYLQRNPSLQDIAIVEMMVARCLERHIARSIRAIVMAYGVETVLSTAWGCFEGSDCKTMPLQKLPQGVIGPVSKQDENAENYYEEQIVVLVSDFKPEEKAKITWMRSDIETSSPSDDLASEKLPAAPTITSPPLSMLKDFLEQKGCKVQASSDGLSRGAYILVTKVVKLEERINRNGPKISVDGPLCASYQTIVTHVGEWLSSLDSQ